jgi:hypothetical protein
MRYPMFCTLVLAFLCAGCGLARQAELKAKHEAAVAEIKIAQQECIDLHKSGELKTFTARAKCLNDADDRIVRPLFGANGDLLNLRQATRLSLAEKVDQKRMSEAEAQLEFAKMNSEIVSEEQRRINANRSVGAQEAAAAAASSPVTCTRFGKTTTCF